MRFETPIETKPNGDAPPGSHPDVDRRPPAPARVAMTLVELLVVIVLVTILVTTAIPVLSPGGDTRKLREASRAINTYLAG
ncbi:MAG: hypothetical protein AAF805_06760, partial [Planctomycetota bacterium]